MSESSGYDSGSFEDEFQLSPTGQQLDYEHPAARFGFGHHHGHYSSFDLKSPLDDTFDPTLDYDTTPPDTLAVHSYNGLPSFSQSQSQSASTPDVGSSFSSEPDDDQFMVYPSSYLADLSMHHRQQAQAQALSSSLDQKIPMGTETLPWDNLSPDSPPAQQPLWPLVDASLPELHLPPTTPSEQWMQVQRAQQGGEMDIKGFFQEQFSDGLDDGGVSF
ncbi:hypothetical protein KEM56_003674 [Ascosphaera pollenicola]|nr:hypothetical protein KEM56_003674 [Ascosphaera pollenicola]